MKKMIFSMLFISAAGMSYAQCNQKVTYNAIKTDYLDSRGAVQQSRNESTLVNFDNQDVSILSNGEQLVGSVMSSSCDWKKSFAEGKTVLKANINDNKGAFKNATLTIEGKDGLISMLIEMDNVPARKLQISSDVFRSQQ